METLGARFSSVGPLLGGVLNLFAIPGVGTAVEKAAGFTEKMTKIDRSVETQHRKLSDALKSQRTRFLVVVDDIDRLSTDDALQVFRLIKSVGRLPNVIYLLAYDKLLAERMISERFPSEGPSYLEKIVQGAFDLPIPDQHDLKGSIFQFIDKYMKFPAGDDDKVVRFLNFFHDITYPLIHTPRDVVRLQNAIRVSWPAVSEDVDRTDFISIESLRLFMPTVHSAIRNHKELLCGGSVDGNYGRQRDGIREKYDEIFLSGLDAVQTDLAKNALMRLFPKTESIWSNVFMEERNHWRAQKQICSSHCFDNYFRFTLGDDTLPESEIKAILDNASNHEFIAETLQKLSKESRKRSGTKAAVFLEEVAARAKEVPEEHIPDFLRGIFSVADDIDVDADKAKGFSFGDNLFRIQWLLNDLVLDRFDQEKRSELIKNACGYAQLEWLDRISRRCLNEHLEREDQDQKPYEDRFVTHNVATEIREMFAVNLRSAAADGSLSQHQSIVTLLYRWSDLDGAAKVRSWTDQNLDDDDFVVSLAEKLIKTSWTQGLSFSGMGDRVSRKHEYVNFESTREFLDVERFRCRVNELIEKNDIGDEESQILKKFQNTPEENPHR